MPPLCLSGLVSRDAGVLSLALKGAEQSGHLMFVILNGKLDAVGFVYLDMGCCASHFSGRGGCLSGDRPADLFHS